MTDEASAFHLDWMQRTILLGYPGIVSDRELASTGPQPALTTELCQANLWVRVEDGDWTGYRILDFEMIDPAVKMMRRGLWDQCAQGALRCEYQRRAGERGFFLPAEIADRALEVHKTLIIWSVIHGTPGFISRHAVDTIRPSPHKEIQALHRAGMWDHDREELGYRVMDQQTVDSVLNAAVLFEERQASCVAAGGHVPDPLRGIVSIEGATSQCRHCSLFLYPGAPIRPSPD